MNNHPTAIIIFGRYPHPGKVKTRLASSIGDDTAAEFYRLCAEHTFRQLTPFLSHSSIFFYCADSEDFSLTHEWVTPYRFTTEIQSGSTLGERMRSAFDSAFQTGAKQVIIIGTDAPDISSEVLQTSVAALENADIVIGPALDGGYYLLGMKQPNKDLFGDIPWSTDTVFQATIEKAQSHHLTTQLLPVLTDIDTLEDLLAWRNTSSAESNIELFHFAKKF